MTGRRTFSGSVLFVFLYLFSFASLTPFRLTFTSSHSLQRRRCRRSLFLPLFHSAAPVFIESTCDIMVDIDCSLPSLAPPLYVSSVSFSFNKGFCSTCKKTLAQRLGRLSLFSETHNHAQHRLRGELWDLIASNSSSSSCLPLTITPDRFYYQITNGVGAKKKIDPFF